MRRSPSLCVRGAPIDGTAAEGVRYELLSKKSWRDAALGSVNIQVQSLVFRPTTNQGTKFWSLAQSLFFPMNLKQKI